jgi:hypothetical protein
MELHQIELNLNQIIMVYKSYYLIHKFQQIVDLFGQEDPLEQQQ